MIWFVLALACGEEEVDPLAECQASGAECCEDADCGDGQTCFNVWTCTANGCSEPEGDRRCHDLCEDTGGVCDAVGESCQEVDWAQGTDYKETRVACL